MAHAVDGTLNDWTLAERLDDARTGVSNYALYATLENDQYVFAIQSPIAIGVNTTLWLNTDRNESTGAEAYSGAGTGAEYYINVEPDGTPLLYTYHGAGQNPTITPVTFVYGANNLTLEIAVPVSALGGAASGLDLKVDVNNATFLPFDYNLFKYSVAPNGYYGLFGDATHDVHSLGGQVYALYSGLLGRAPDTLGLEYWADQLEHGASARTLGDLLLSSQEGQARAGALGNSDFVQQLYQSTLGRPADADGLNYWTGQLNGGAARVDVASGFVFSDEHLSSLKSVFDTGLFVPDKQAADVARLYYTMLNRAPDASGLKYWESQLDHGGSLSSLAQAFLGTPENQAKYGSMANSDYVDALYMNALGRHAETDGLTYWTTQLNGGTSRADLAVLLADSAEAHSVHLAQVEQGWFLS
ncbi:DUF4214 domain-containing protein [Methylobacterium durans]|uniref:DUF4214 domain-containing protein n=1 Tax=Methylobacterium durans TaxID=2202825 RepID=A0A2U8W1G1_9HYPH|nr:DUF4214 domain-containing protein [Methylobacterium durans]AWN39903.1 hypothetical protein DK389_04320 [Methylobacterium durans]